MTGVPQNLSLAQSEIFLEFYSKYLRSLCSCLKSQLNNKMAARRMIMQNIIRHWIFTGEEVFVRYIFRSFTILFICSLVENALKEFAFTTFASNLSSTSVLCHGSILPTQWRLACHFQVGRRTSCPRSYLPPLFTGKAVCTLPLGFRKRRRYALNSSI